MIRRPAVTLMEVLIAMFIMAIGMLALLALFPVGAVSMAAALKDDRCAYASQMSENVAIANNIRYGETYVFAALANLIPTLGFPNSGLVYVDPYGVYASDVQAVLPPPGAPFGFPIVGVGGVPVIPRVAPSFVYYPAPILPATPLGSTPPSTPLVDRWFSLPDDMSFNLSGTPDTSNTGGVIDRGRRYSYAYFLRQQPPQWSSNQSTMKSVQLYAVVYSGRPVNSLTVDPVNHFLTGEPPYTAIGAAGTNSIVLSPTGTSPWPPSIKRGGWILDTSYGLGAAAGQLTSINGYFYRVTNVVEAGSTLIVEVQQNLVSTIGAPINTGQITVMDYVAEVFDKGYGWQQ